LYFGAVKVWPQEAPPGPTVYANQIYGWNDLTQTVFESMISGSYTITGYSLIGETGSYEMASGSKFTLIPSDFMSEYKNNFRGWVDEGSMTSIAPAAFSYNNFNPTGEVNRFEAAGLTTLNDGSLNALRLTGDPGILSLPALTNIGTDTFLDSAFKELDAPLLVSASGNTIFQGFFPANAGNVLTIDALVSLSGTSSFNNCGATRIELPELTTLRGVNHFPVMFNLNTIYMPKLRNIATVSNRLFANNTFQWQSPAGGTCTVNSAVTASAQWAAQATFLSGRGWSVTYVNG
jgi:hypothetical protein